MTERRTLALKDPALLTDKAFVAGAWITAPDGKSFAVTDPFDGAFIANVPDLGQAVVAQAIDAAADAQKLWARRTAKERAQVLKRWYDLIIENADDLALILTTEQGKSLTEARGEVGASANYAMWFAEEARRAYGDTIPSPWPERRIMVVKQPVGVVAAITPWNFPTLMLARKIGAALSAGCTVVAKPASQTPYSAIAWALLAEEAGVPKGVLNVVTGAAREIGAELVESPFVRKITFTGSTEVGKQLTAAAAATMKRVSMELGGNAPFIVFDDADLDAAVAGAIQSKYRNSGQTCVCANRFLVQSGVREAFVAKLAAAAADLKVGNGLEDGVAQGPLIDEAAVAKVEEHLADALAKGARLVTGGKRLGGSFFAPTVVDGVTTAMKVAREETFGPLAPVFSFETEDEAIAMANDTEFGLAAYAYTRDLGRAFRVMERLQYGQVGINAGVITTEVAPFGGVKDSGLGREGSKYGIEGFLELKYVALGGL
jgi:succinate-semialdehyde dehydrogenase/glutarate-semialdehyde dehydrogenase